MARQIVVDIVGDSSKFSKSVNDATGKTSKFNTVLNGIGLGTGFGLVTKGIDLAVDAMQNAVEASSKLEQSTGAVESVFGPAADKIKKFGQTADTSFGLSKNSVNEMAAVMGSQLKSMGFNADQAADQTLALQERAADMAAVFGGPTSNAVEAMSALLRGERDPIEKYGVSIKDADVKARILAMGLDTSTTAAQKNAVAVASMSLLMEQTNQTQGQFALQTDSLAEKQQIMGARFENVAASIGAKLLPVFVSLAGFVLDAVIPTLENVIQVITDIWNAIQPTVSALVRELTPAFKTVIGFITGTVIPVIKNVASVVLPILWNATKTVASIWSTAFNTVKTVISGAATVISGVVTGINTVITTIGTTVGTIATNIRVAWNTLMQFLGGLPARVGNAVSGMWNGLWNGFKSVVNSIIRGWNSLKFSLPSIDLGPLGKVGGFTIGTPNIPYLHTGGIVPGPKGADVLSILQAGERVIPANQADSGRSIIIQIEGNVYGSGGIDELSNQIAKRLRLAGG